MKHIYVLIFAASVLLAACSDSTGPGSATDGSLSFSYTAGATSSSYSATGTYNPATATHTSTWSTAWSSSADNSIVVLSNRGAGGGLADGALLVIDRQTAGTSAIDPDCEPTAIVACTSITFAIGINEAGTNFSFSCFLAAGSITISEVSASRISGSFEGEAVCISNAAIAEGTVTNGTFSTPLLSEEPGGV
jgi:hypothetical protein